MEENKPSTEEKPEVITHFIQPHDVFIKVTWDFGPSGQKESKED